MLKVLAFTRYTSVGASSRVRVYQFIDEIRNYNINIHPSPLFGKNYIDLLYIDNKRSFSIILFAYIKRFFKLFTVHKYDLIFIEKELFPFLPGLFEKILWLIKKKIHCRL